MIQKISSVINNKEDQFIIIDLGTDENILEQATVLGKKNNQISKNYFYLSLTFIYFQVY